MNTKKILAIMVILLMGSQFAFANYAFYKKVSSTCKYYRVSVDQKKMALTKNADGSSRAYRSTFCRRHAAIETF